jgi:hypothetical protein
MTEAQLMQSGETTSTLVNLCEEWQTEITSKLPTLPPDIWRIFSFLALQKQQVIGQTFVLSVICPIIENPVLFKVLSTTPGPKPRRTLAIISDIFTKKATQNLFLETGNSFSQLNGFILNRTQKFFQDIQDWAGIRPSKSLSLFALPSH